MNRFTLIPLIIFLLTFGASVLMSIDASAKSNWVVSMPFCNGQMAKNAKKQLKTGKGKPYHNSCKMRGFTRAIDARCVGKNLQVKCK